MEAQRKVYTMYSYFSWNFVIITSYRRADSYNIVSKVKSLNQIVNVKITLLQSSFFCFSLFLFDLLSLLWCAHMLVEFTSIASYHAKIALFILNRPTVVVAEKSWKKRLDHFIIEVNYVNGN